MIKVGRIVSVISEAGNGINNAQRVRIALQDDIYERVAYVKSMGDTAFLVELVCALLGRELGLPIPEPVIAFSEDGSEVLFASTEIDYPDLSRQLIITNNKIENTPVNREIFKALSKWESIVDAISFDEWIANHDRNLGNILYNGEKTFILIDHDGAMRLPFDPSQPVPHNTLMKVAIAHCDDNELSMQRLKNKVKEVISNLDKSLPKVVADKILNDAPAIDDKLLTSMVRFLSERLNHLDLITTNKVPVRQMSL